jgi:hypothetical protein
MAEFIHFVINFGRATFNRFSNWRSQFILKQRVRACRFDPSLRVVVYTAIFAGKDKLKEPPRFTGVDYVCFTDDQHLSSKTWKIVKVKGPYQDPRKNAKLYKVLPHRFFPDYEYSLWVDGTHMPVVDARFLVHTFLRKEHIALFAHPVRNCIYEEMEVCLRYNKEDVAVIAKLKQKYLNEKYPCYNGLATCTVVLRKHHVPKVQRAMEDWWQEIENYSMRDQLSFNYIARRHQLGYAVIPGDIYHNHYFSFSQHLRPDYRLDSQWLCRDGKIAA